MEYLDLYDNERNLTNEKICRGDEIPDNRYILLTCIIIENSKNELLMQFTSPEKNSVWALTGGHVTTGEDTLSTIIRESKEELGLELDRDNIELITTKQCGPTFFDLYYVQKDVTIEELSLQKEEVDFVKWCTLDELDKYSKEGTLRKSNINMLNDFKKYKNLK